MEITKSIIAWVSVMSAALTTTALAQNKPIPKQVSVVDGRTDTTMIFKDESGKPLQSQYMMALMRTGDYKIVKAIGKDKKPYWLVKKAPGFAPRPEIPPVVVKP